VPVRRDYSSHALGQLAVQACGKPITDAAGVPQGTVVSAHVVDGDVILEVELDGVISRQVFGRARTRAQARMGRSAPDA
jgi:hypothetical protein